MKLFILAIIVTCLAAVSSEKARYDNYRVYAVEIENQQQLKLLQDIEIQRDGILFIKFPTNTQQRAELIVPPHKFGEIKTLFEAHNIKNWIEVDDLQKYD